MTRSTGDFKLASYRLSSRMLNATTPANATPHTDIAMVATLPVKPPFGFSFLGAGLLFVFAGVVCGVSVTGFPTGVGVSGNGSFATGATGSCGDRGEAREAMGLCPGQSPCISASGKCRDPHAKKRNMVPYFNNGAVERASLVCEPRSGALLSWYHLS